METNNVLNVGELHNPDIKFVSDEVLSIRHDLDLIWWSMPPDGNKDFIHQLQLVSTRLTSLYSSLYRVLCR